ncbi:hypothetical protein KAR91_66485 [Candidatus Pacearchaeota archaeon]|nr:hypothetical protein [Candidatus Pacearchaeota archaeon]
MAETKRKAKRKAKPPIAVSKRGVVNPVYGMTEAAFFGKFRSMLRKEWRHSQPYRDALRRAKVPYFEPGRRKFSIRCEKCSDEYALQERIVIGKTKVGKAKDALAYQIDHKIDAGSLKSFEDLSGFTERLFCPPEDLQVLCYWCHKKKTHN